MKRVDLIKSIESLGCVLIRHGAEHDWYRVIARLTNVSPATSSAPWAMRVRTIRRPDENRPLFTIELRNLRRRPGVREIRSRRISQEGRRCALLPIGGKSAF